MKIIKLIFKLILLLITLLIIGVIVLVVVAYDTSDLNYDPKTESNKIEDIIGSGLYESLNNIYDTNYDAESNKIEICLSSNELNNYFFSLIRTSVDGASHYYDGTEEEITSIVSANNITLKTIEFYINENNTLAARARIEMYGYKTTILLNANIKITNYDKLKEVGATYSGKETDYHIFEIDFNEVKFGSKIGISAEIVKSIFETLNLKFNTGEVNFDVNRLAFYFNFDEIFKNICSDNFLLSLIESCDYDVYIKNNSEEPKIYLSINTEDLFLGEQEMIGSSKEGAEAKILALLPEIISSPDTTHELLLTEEEFNGYAKDYILNRLSNFTKTFEIGSYSFTCRISDLSYSISKSKIISNLAFNNTKTYLDITTSITNLYDSSDFIESINISFDGISVGKNIETNNLVDNSLKEIDSVSLDIDEIFTNTYSNYIQNIEFDSINNNVILTFKKR